MGVYQYKNNALNRIAGISDNTFTGTTAEVDLAIAAGQIHDNMIVNITDDGTDTVTALEVSYDNTGTSITSTSVQGAITELVQKIEQVMQQ